MNDFHHDPSPVRNPSSVACRMFAAFLALAAFAGPATSADITVTPPSGGGFVVTNADKSAERLRVNDDGSITIPGTVSFTGPVTFSGTLEYSNNNSVDGVKIDYLKIQDSTNPVGNIFVCVNSSTGRLSRCSPPTGHPELGVGPIYVKKAVFTLSSDVGQAFTPLCDHIGHTVIVAAAYLQSSANEITSIGWEGYQVNVLVRVSDAADQLTVNYTCLRKG